MLGEDRTDFENKLNEIKEENDQMQKQIIEGQEETDETRRNLRECEAKLAQVNQANEAKTQKMIELEKDLTEKVEAQTGQITELKTK